MKPLAAVRHTGGFVVDDRLVRIVPLALEHGAAYGAIDFVVDATAEPLTNLDRPIAAVIEMAADNTVLNGAVLHANWGERER